MTDRMHQAGPRPRDGMTERVEVYRPRRELGLFVVVLILAIALFCFVLPGGAPLK